MIPFLPFEMDFFQSELLNVKSTDETIGDGGGVRRTTRQPEAK